MKKLTLFCLFTLVSLGMFAQGKYHLENTKVHFFSTAPLEDIEATNVKTVGMVDFATNKFAFKIPIEGFEFPKKLMQEHFNENYLHSAKFPHGTFSGTLTGAYDLTKDGEYPVQAVGELNIHGVAMQRTIPATIIVNKGKMSIKAKFDVKLVDHNIEIPSIVFNKIAEVIAVDVFAELIKHN